MVAPIGDLPAGMVAGAARTSARYGRGIGALVGGQLGHCGVQCPVRDGQGARTRASTRDAAVWRHTGAGPGLHGSGGRHPSFAAPVCGRFPQGTKSGGAGAAAPDPANRGGQHLVTA